MDKDKSIEELRLKAKELSIPLYREDEESYLMDRSKGTVDTPDGWLEHSREYLADRREKELEELNNRAEEDYKKTLSELKGININDAEMPKMSKIKVPEDVDWEETFKGISDLSTEEWNIATRTLERKEHSKQSQTKLEKEWRLAEKD